MRAKGRREGTLLSDRRQLVLASLIEEYVARALPVGSRTLTERYSLGVSPATVRNELSALEEEGYITQPHTSAGRIPTDYGYRAFVDKLLEDGVLYDDEEHEAAVSTLKNSALELDELLERTNSALARLTDCLSIVVAPHALEAEIKQITVIGLSEYRAVLVIVTCDGMVYNRHLDFAQAVSAEELADIQRFANELFCRGPLNEQSFNAACSADALKNSPITRMVVDEIAECLKEHGRSRMINNGISSLMKQPEFHESKSLIPIMQMIEDDAMLLQIVDSAQFGSGSPVVQIGRENNSETLQGVSVVASRYGRGDAAGIVAVIGPTRMDYSNVIKAVRIASAALQDE